MRIAAVAFVLIVGAAVVLAFANTLNSWVLGGLLGGLAAILLCIPISLTIFALLTRRQEARQRVAEAGEAEGDLMEGAYEEGMMVYEAEGYALPFDDEQFPAPRALPAPRSAPVSGYLALPPVHAELDPYYEDDEQEMLARRDPRNYPRNPRHVTRLAGFPQNEPSSSSPATGNTRRPATRSLAHHQSAALRKARQEAQQQRLVQRRGESDSRRLQGGRSAPTHRPRTSHLQPSRVSRTQSPREPRYQPEDEYDTWRQSQRSEYPGWHNDIEDPANDFSTGELSEDYQQYPRQASYPRNPRSRRPQRDDPWTNELDSRRAGDREQETEDPRSRRAYSPRSRRPQGRDPWTNDLDEEQEPRGEDARSRRLRPDPERFSGNLHSPLVRRAPYLYEDDPLNAEFARQIDHNHPITRRTTRSDRYQDEDE